MFLQVLFILITFTAMFYNFQLFCSIIVKSYTGVFMPSLENFTDLVKKKHEEVEKSITEKKRNGIVDIFFKRLKQHGFSMNLDLYLKKVNNAFGHIADDKTPILLSKEEARKIAKRIMKTIRAKRLFYKNQIIKTTLSMGPTEYRRGNTFESMIERIDAAVYRAIQEKKNGLAVC